LTGKDLGRYHLLAQIGRGGMASVYRAYDPQQDRLVAIKVLSADLAGDPRFSRRFRREAELVSQLSHPNIVPVWDYGEAEGHAYLVMPFIKVGSLADRLRRKQLSLEECTRILDQVTAALDFAHSRGVVHRDIKPSNILLDDKGNALLTDFGLAQIHDASMSLTGSAMLGTPSYISPEQARGDTVDGRADQYSLGIILFELATGVLPFDAETPMAVVIKHIQEPVPRPRDVNPQVPEAIEQVILKATAKDPKHRFATMAEFNRAFRAALAHASDPDANPAPHIDLPPSDPGATLAMVGRGRGAGRPRRLLPVVAGLVVLLLCVWVSPVLGRILSGRPTGTPVVLLSGTDEAQLTALAATIGGLTTQIAEMDGAPLDPAEVQSAVHFTLTAIAWTPTSSVTLPVTPSQTATATETATVTATARPSLPPPTRTATRRPTATVTRTSGGAVSPAATAMPTTVSATLPHSETPTLAPSDTQAPTSAPSTAPTEAPSSTPPPPPTSTSPPPPTSTPNVCAMTSVTAAGVQWREARWTIANQGSSTITITGLHLDWPSSNDDLILVELRNATIWDKVDHSPPTDITGGWAGGSRSIGAGDSARLDFRFNLDAAGGGYSVSITLNGACSVGGGQ
jgi:serine/threonine-protein kinase